MPDNLTIDKGKTAVLIMDCQNEIVALLPQDRQEMVLQKASRVLTRSRQIGLPVIYVVVGFREGYPELSLRNKTYVPIRENNRLIAGSMGTEIRSEVAPKKGEIVVTKRRLGAFSTTELGAALSAKDINTLVIMGVATSGCVLSTVRWAADMDYRLIVVSDGCADRDEEVHRVLTEKVFPRQATVVTAEEFISTLNK